VAKKLEQRLNQAGRAAIGSIWAAALASLIKETYAELLSEQPARVIGFCMAPQQSSLSTGAYQKKVEEARSSLQSTCPVSYVGSWNRHPQLIAAIVENIRQGLAKFPADVRATVPVLFTAHSLPERIVQMEIRIPRRCAARWTRSSPR